MKRRLVVSALALVLLLGLAAAETAGCTNANAGNLPKGVMARVGQVSITQEQLDAKVAAYAKFGAAPDKTADPTGYDNFRRDVLDDMITYELVKQQSAALEISVTAKEVQDSIDKFKTDTYNGDQAAFDDALKQHNITPDELNTSYSESLLMQKAYDAVTKSLTD